MVTGVILARYGAEDRHLLFAGAGIAQTMVGGGLLIWAAFHYEQLHGPLREGNPVVHPTATRLLAYATMIGSAFAIAAALVFAVD